MDAQPILHWQYGEYTLTTDKDVIDRDTVHRFLAEQSYWAQGIPRTVVDQAIDGSLCFSLIASDGQCGFARVITDCATFAYLADVFVLPEKRGKGLSKWMMACITSHPRLQGLRRWMLATWDAHGLYQQFGFTPLTSPERIMERFNPKVYAPS